MKTREAKGLYKDQAHIKVLRKYSYYFEKTIFMNCESNCLLIKASKTKICELLIL